MNIKLFGLAVISLGVVIGMLYQIVYLFRNNDSLSASLLLIGLVSFIGFISIILKRILSELKQGISFEDERSRKIKLHSAGTAYFYSLYIWIGLLAFQKYFTKDDILLLGLIGMGSTLFISWIITKNKKGLE
ncbi:hypothetical protein ACM26V_03920 [Salipaludibacillus sp. HK11]|uniref:hypothetical protein n=1 Tax=Salipaludibacillus sp. HK11 TaxID=3394320 RepID=UPI0039FCE838